MKNLISLILILSFPFSDSECPIECYCDRVITCNGDKLMTRFPLFILNNQSSNLSSQLLSPSSSRLELHDYAVRTLSRADFYNLLIFANLISELSLARNGLEALDNETFTAIPRSGSKPVVSTSNTAFSSEVLNLSTLDLSQNQLTYFKGGGKLAKCRLLDLSSNKLQQVRGLASMGKLESVNLRDNLISRLDPHVFQGLKFLQYINLDANRLTSFDSSTFSNLPAFAHLILSSNPVHNWTTPGFYWNSRVQFVDVSHVGLSTVPSCLTTTIRDFRLSNNNLSLIRQGDFESYPNVGLLVLDENAIESVEDDAFGRLEYLKRLWMNGNRLTKIPKPLPSSLLSLHLEDNLVSSLSSSDFKNLRNLIELNLHGNSIATLPPFVFSELANLKNLDLRTNRVEALYHESFSRLEHLETLDLSQNPLKVIVTGAFSSLHKLSLLHLSRLGETVLEFDPSSVFTGLDKLEVLEASDSSYLVTKLFQSKPSSFSQHLPSLSELNLQRCELQNVHEVASVLMEMSGSLRVVKLSGNPWTCQSQKSESKLNELVGRRELMVDHPTCESPPELKGVLLSSLNLSSLYEPLDEEVEEGVMMEYESESESESRPGAGVNQSLQEAMTTGPHGVDTRNNNNRLNSSSSSGGERANEVEDRVGLGGLSNSSHSGKFQSESRNTTTDSLDNNNTNSVVVQPTASYFETKVIDSRLSSSSYLSPTTKTSRTRTNDGITRADNEESESREAGKSNNEARQTTQKSIDGLPSGSSGQEEKERRNSHTFFLRRGGGEESIPSSSALAASTSTSGNSSAEGMIIVKTIIISAAAAFISVSFILFLLGLGAYKRSGGGRRYDTGLNCATFSSRSDNGYFIPGEEPITSRSYKRFGDDDDDDGSVIHLSESGIANKLYSSTRQQQVSEEVYHIS